MSLFQNLKLNLISFLIKLWKVVDQFLRLFSIQLLNLYKLLLSPYMGWNCRFYPTCSSYSLEAFKKYSFVTASWLTFKRIISCRPFGPQGYDPVECCKDEKLIWSKNG